MQQNSFIYYLLITSDKQKKYQTVPDWVTFAPKAAVFKRIHIRLVTSFAALATPLDHKYHTTHTHS